MVERSGIVRCKACGQVLEPSGTDAGNRCPSCGSTDRICEVQLETSDDLSIGLRERIDLKRRGPAGGKPLQELMSGDDLSIRTGEWMDKRRLVDRENDRYEETVRHRDTHESVHESDERLSDHRDHESAKKSKRDDVGLKVKLLSGSAIVLYIAATKLLFHLVTANRYGIFRDELYYIACAEHLDWGYVDQPPLIAFIAWVSVRVFGSSLLGLRFLPAIAGAGLVWITGRLTKELGGGRSAQVLAAAAVALAPIYLMMHHWMTMNAFEPLIWMGCVWCIIRAINTGRGRYWIGFGILVGIGMETKYTTAFFVLGVIIGLLLTPHRQVLRNRWFWIGALSAFIIFLPNLVWLIQHDFPFLELMENIRRSGRDVVRGPLAFVADQAMILNPVSFPLWILGLMWLFLGRQSRYRVLAWAYLALLTTFILLKGKNYYVAPAYPMLFAGGGIFLEGLSRPIWKQIRFVYFPAILFSGAALGPLTSPLLPIPSYLRYQKALGVEPMRAENQASGPLPQYFADEFGWEEMTREVARVYNGLPADQRTSTAIFANGYGQAGAIDFFGPKYGLPKVISNHQSYWLWGPREYTGESVIVLGSDGTGDREHFNSVEVVGRVQHPYSRLDENFDIFLCRELTSELNTIWPQIKNWN